MTWAIVATILGLGAMAQAEFWAREWHDKKRRRRAAEKRLARIYAKQEERERVRMRLEIAESVREARERLAEAVKSGDKIEKRQAIDAYHAISDAARMQNSAFAYSAADAYAQLQGAQRAGGHGQSWLLGAQQGADVGTTSYSDVGTGPWYPPDY